MRTLLLVALASLLLCAAAAKVPAGKRLIQFNETSKVWLDEAEVDKLIFQPGMHHFMDVTDFEDLESHRPLNQLPIPTQPVQQPYVRILLNEARSNMVRASIDALSTFFTRYYRSDTGVEAARWVQNQYAFYARGRDDIDVENFTHIGFPQPSVLATIWGDGPNQDSVVIIGAHLDSVGSSATGRSPGADDDGSGTACLLEIFRVLADGDYVPDFTLQFIGYAAEEGGLLGSQEIAAEYIKEGINVHAALQLDMTGYNTNGALTAGIVTDFTSAELSQFVRTLVETYTELKWGNYRCGYACSDHASWNKTGFRSAFPFETPFGSNPFIHSAQDTADRLDTNQLLQFVNLGIGFAVEVAGVAPEK